MVIAVLAGNRAEFLDYVERLMDEGDKFSKSTQRLYTASGHTFFYVFSLESIRGVWIDDYVLIGSWANRPDAEVIHLELSIKRTQSNTP